MRISKLIWADRKKIFFGLIQPISYIFILALGFNINPWSFFKYYVVPRIRIVLCVHWYCSVFSLSLQLPPPPANAEAPQVFSLITRPYTTLPFSPHLGRVSQPAFVIHEVVLEGVRVPVRTRKLRATNSWEKIRFHSLGFSNCLKFATHTSASRLLYDLIGLK